MAISAGKLFPSAALSAFSSSKFGCGNHVSRAFQARCARRSFNFLLTSKALNEPCIGFADAGFLITLYAVIAEIFYYLAYTGVADGLAVGRDELV